ncbi:MAG: molybdopterin-dependent oxidoreductase [Oceanococcaceae bacterium]
MPTKHSYCRICEAHCGLLVDVDDDGQTVNAIRPDRTHPVSQGYACIKGTSFAHIHDDPDRLNFPEKKVDGKWVRIDWDTAIREIGGKLKALRKAHGPRSLGHYYGNPTAFNLENFLYSASFLQALGSPNVFSSSSIDLNNKFHVAKAMYGMLDVHPVPNFARCGFFLCLGSNPMVSQMSVVAVPHVMDKLKAIRARGGRTVVIDPRRTETAQKLGEHHFIRPGTDALLLLGMLHVIARDPALQSPSHHTHADDVETFLRAADDFPPARVAAATGMSADVIVELARAYATANGGVIYMSTGVNMGPFGSLAYWLVQGLSLITGNLDAPGGLVFSHGPFDMRKVIAVLDGAGDTGTGTASRAPRSLKDGWPHVAGGFPSGALADEITIDHPERIRALIVSAGNPVHSIPGNRLTEAFAALDLLVAIDIYPSETSEYADYRLPATDMLERSDFPMSHLNFQATPHAQYTPAMVAPKYERRTEGWIFSQLARAAGAPWRGPSLMNAPARLNRLLEKLPGLRPLGVDDLLAVLLRIGGHTTLKELKSTPQGVSLGPLRTGWVLGKRVPTANGNVQMAPASLLEDVPRAAAFLDRAPAAGTLQMIGRRERRSHNSWMHNNRGIRHDRGITVLIHPEDAQPRDLHDGDRVQITPDGMPMTADAETAVTLTVEISTDIMPGVICAPHGWGHGQSGLAKARGLPGANINRALPDAAHNMEPVSGQAIMTGHAVRLSKSCKVDAEVTTAAA